MLEQIKKRLLYIKSNNLFDEYYISDMEYLIGEVERLQEHIDLQTEPISEVTQFWVDASTDKDKHIEELQKALEESMKLLNNTVMAMVVKGDHESAKSLTVHIEALERSETK